jgi:hypothetical protein
MKGSVIDRFIHTAKSELSGVVDADEKFINGVIDTGESFQTVKESLAGVVDTDNKFFAVVNDTANAPEE